MLITTDLRKYDASTLVSILCSTGLKQVFERSCRLLEMEGRAYLRFRQARRSIMWKWLVRVSVHNSSITILNCLRTTSTCTRLGVRVGAGSIVQARIPFRSRVSNITRSLINTVFQLISRWNAAIGLTRTAFGTARNETSPHACLSLVPTRCALNFWRIILHYRR